MNLSGLTDVNISYNRLLATSVIYVLLVFAFLYSVTSIDNYHIMPYFLIILLSWILISFFLLQRNIDLFDPMTLFTIYYFTIIPTGYYFVSNNFEKGEYATSYGGNIYSFFNVAMIYIICGYLSALAGYFSTKRSGLISIKYEPVNEISNRLLLSFALINFMAGVLNFAVNVMKISGGDISAYMNTMSVRHALYQEIPHTTLFYMNTYISIYLFMYYLKRKQINNAIIVLPLSVAVFMLFSTGRIFTTISFILSVFAIYYYTNINYIKYTKKFLLWLFAILFSSIIFYLYRIVSNLSLSYADIPSLFEVLAIFDPLFFFQLTIEKGNTPNIPVLMKIIDSWGNEIGFLYGQSLVSWIVNILPTAIRPEGYQPSVMIMHAEWFPYAQGAHPPTGIGEMYANFGLIGPFAGMFLFGMFCAWMRNQLTYYKNFWILIVYCQVVTGFVFLYPKGEFDNLSLWQVLPVLFSYFVLRIFTKVFASKKTYKIGVAVDCHH